MIKFIYPDVITEIRKSCLEHLKGNISLIDFQKAIYFAEVAIRAVEENDVRDFFMYTESDLELIRFTVDEDNQLEESQKVAQRVLDWLFERENGV
jgi:hypothetical protein